MVSAHIEVDPPRYRTLLKGCPFCGHYPEMVKWHGGGPQKRLISCVNDYCKPAPSVVGATPSRAAKAWNERAEFA